MIATPLFQTVFEPVFIQVNILPAAVLVDPSLEHFAPAFGVAAMLDIVDGMRSASEIAIATFLLIEEVYLIEVQITS